MPYAKPLRRAADEVIPYDGLPSPSKVATDKDVRRTSGRFLSASRLSIDEAPADSKPILKAIEEKFGQSMNLFRTLAYQPDVLGGVTQINHGLDIELP